MYEFLDRLISLALPRVRDFRGLNPNAFDGHGNYSLGLSEQLVFPELNPDKFTAAARHEHHARSSHGQQQRRVARAAARLMGMPFKVPEAKGKDGTAGKCRTTGSSTSKSASTDVWRRR